MGLLNRRHRDDFKVSPEQVLTLEKQYYQIHSLIDKTEELVDGINESVQQHTSAKESGQDGEQNR